MPTLLRLGGPWSLGVRRRDYLAGPQPLHRPLSVPLIHSPEQVGDLVEPNPKNAGMTPLIDRFNSLSRGQGFPASLPGGTPTTLSAGIVGRANFLRWLVRYPEAVHALQEKVTSFKEMEGMAGVHLMTIELEHRVAEIAERAKCSPGLLPVTSLHKT